MESLTSLLTSHFTLNTTTQLKLSRPRPTPPPSTEKLVRTAIALLRDHEAYIRLNPLVSTVAAVPPKESKLDIVALLREFQSDDSKTDDEDGKDWTHYSITDSLPLPLGLPGTQDLKYAAALADLADGMRSLVLAPAGVTILGNVVVEVREGDRGEETLWLRECARVRCWWGMAWYIKGTMGKSHERLHEGFRGVWERRVRGGG